MERRPLSSAPPLGSILDGRYQLVTQVLALVGRPRFIARDLLHDGETVELVITGREGARFSFDWWVRRLAQVA